MTALPQIYVERIAALLGDETGAFLRSMEAPRSYGLRLHTPKLSAANGEPAMRSLTSRFGLAPVPWCGTGFAYDGDTRPGKHPYHHAGLYYIQEPSAMIAAELLDPQPGDVVLDLAAAPGGKTTQIAAKLKGEGLLVANEIHPGRARVLSENVERLGIANAVVVQATPGELAARLPEAFDKIMLDAPCSGEGMFRKEPEACAEWSVEAVAMCAARQRDILPDAAAMLKPGGRLVYATCTFNREENEETIAWFLAAHPAFRLVAMKRMWPHRGEGEGHFAAVLEKEGLPAVDSDLPSKRRAKGGKSPRPDVAGAVSALKLYEAFAARALPGYALPASGVPLLFGESLYWYPQPAGSPLPAASLDGLRTHRPGLHLGDVKKGRFEPAHALAHAVCAGDAALIRDYPADSAAVSAYLRGEALFDDQSQSEQGDREGRPAQGWGLLCADGYPLGWFKASGGQLKNHYPKGLRTN
ncbi:RsmB/NOP family class I SAM-dependent RNA methyltransferase [Cohnella rhizosphaerae]|uniref:RsmB/NOP family class I SAM-dependent RNA methyltransferase n=1 Tax=Cohnella rhizosphaerae TaxID=1457232 RepID=A0A9X4KZ38_9BACL|nr:RsmB/NOP family class I SAM-dependent RNA methyltransferase [Cohnella rhizosphaerae]MDG0813617.1 RsmB/NOP family class I SAM-dependent RNA methyltransferase [Cohnella rhizosphaerae]